MHLAFDLCKQNVKGKLESSEVNDADLDNVYSKAYIPPETVFALAAQCEQILDKQHQIDMRQQTPMRRWVSHWVVALGCALGLALGYFALHCLPYTHYVVCIGSPWVFRYTNMLVSEQ